MIAEIDLDSFHKPGESTAQRNKFHCLNDGDEEDDRDVTGGENETAFNWTFPSLPCSESLEQDDNFDDCGSCFCGLNLSLDSINSFEMRVRASDAACALDSRRAPILKVKGLSATSQQDALMTAVARQLALPFGK